MSPRIAVNVQPWESLQARYADAVRDIYDQRAIMQGRVEPPSGRAQHVFDTPAGIRLIVSRERVPSGAVVVHVSASPFEAWPPALALISALVAVAFAKVSGAQTAEMQFCGLTPGGVPHFLIPTTTAERVH